VYGVWDLAGNIAERCLDGFAPYPPAPDPDPLCLDYLNGHVVRGGSWDSCPLDLRITARFGDPHSARDDRTGFRVVLRRTASP
jgi:formylglycine-generating enzyme required for sulfatase activity